MTLGSVGSCGILLVVADRREAAVVWDHLPDATAGDVAIGEQERGV